MSDSNTKVTVCSECLTAACWQGEFRCSICAGSIDLPIWALESLELENEKFWDIDEETGIDRGLMP